MDYFRIQGGRRLAGRVTVEGSKNAALPLMAASLLTDGELKLKNVILTEIQLTLYRNLLIISTNFSLLQELDH